MKKSPPSNVCSLFGERIRLLRTNLGVSQEKLAELSGLHRTYVSDVERGARNVSLVNIVRLSRALKTKPSSLLEGVS